MGCGKLQKITQRLPFGYKNRRTHRFLGRKVGKLETTVGIQHAAFNQPEDVPVPGNSLSLTEWSDAEC
jgi:hypothetical protein